MPVREALIKTPDGHVRYTGGCPVRIRRFIEATLTGAGYPDVICNRTLLTRSDQITRVRDAISETVPGHPALDSIILLASELATNSLRHSGSRFFGLGIARTTADYLRVAVADEGRTGFPCLQDESLEAEGGRGMRILDATVNLWGITREPGIGVAVWFDFAP